MLVLPCPPSPPQPQHDVFWATWVQAIGGLVMVLVTGFLGWATVRLVNVTRVLAEVGDKTWKSSVLPALFINVKTNEEVDGSTARFAVRNACAVDIEDISVSVQGHFGYFNENGNPILEGSWKAQNGTHFDIDKLLGDQTSKELPLWKEIQRACSLNDNAESEDRKYFPLLTIWIGSTHSVTKHRYSVAYWYEIEDRKHGNFYLTKIYSGDPEVIRSVG